LAAYSSITHYVPPGNRKAWGLAVRALAVHWDDLMGIELVRTSIDALLDQVVALADRFQASAKGDAFAFCAMSLAYLGVVTAAVRQHAAELEAFALKGRQPEETAAAPSTTEREEAEVTMTIAATPSEGVNVRDRVDANGAGGQHCPAGSVF